MCAQWNREIGLDQVRIVDIRGTGGPAGYNRGTPLGPGQGRDFYQDFAQPSQVVRDATAALDATKRLPPARACSDRRACSTWGQILPARGEALVMATSGEEHTLQF